jgi:hypothetical protein
VKLNVEYRLHKGRGQMKTRLLPNDLRDWLKARTLVIGAKLEHGLSRRPRRAGDHQRKPDTPPLASLNDARRQVGLELADPRT